MEEAPSIVRGVLAVLVEPMVALLLAEMGLVVHTAAEAQVTMEPVAALAAVLVIKTTTP
jgi:hypothetical protein